MAAADRSAPGQQAGIPFVLMRGGTSKAVFLRQADLPSDRQECDRVILALFGSPDPRQVDGLGGADILTSKLAIIGPPSRADADLDYTFAQVSISEPVVDYDINCGNISAAVGPYAVDEGLVPAVEPLTSVRIHNTNTARILVAELPVAAGAAAVEGDFSIDGVPGTGAPVRLDWAATAGGATGALLPTGRVTDLLELPGLGSHEVSIVDIGNLSVFFRAEAAGMTGTEGPAGLTAEALAAAVAVKEAAAALLGLPAGGLVPVPVAVAEPAAYTSYATGASVSAGELDVLGRVVGGRPPVLHKAFPGTVGVCTAVAAAIPGTVVALTARRTGGDAFVIGHPSGLLPVWARVRSAAGGWEVEQAAYARTARRLAEGQAFVRRSVWPR